MKKIFNISILPFALISCMYLSSCSPSNQKIDKVSVTVNIKVSKSSDYCGGANPGQEMIDELKQPKSMVTQELFLLAENSQSLSEVITLTTDKSGEVNTELATGTYEVFLKEKWNYKARNVTSPGKNRFCDEWKAKGNGRLMIKTDIQEYQLNLHNTCNPCESPSR